MSKVKLVIMGAVFFTFCTVVENPVSAHPDHSQFLASGSVQHNHSAPRPLRPLVVSRGENTVLSRDDITLVVPQYFDVTSKKHEQRPAFFELSGGLYSFLTTGGETARGISVFDFFIPTASPPRLSSLTGTHRHAFDHEVFYVTEGTVSFQFGDLVQPCNPAPPPVGNLCVPNTSDDDIWFDAPVGTFLYLPIGRVHAWANRTGEPARVLSTFVPGGADELFEQVGIPLEQGPAFQDDFDFGRALELLDEFGLTVTGEDDPKATLKSVVLSPDEQVQSHQGRFDELVAPLVTFRDTGGSFDYSNFVLDPLYSGVDPLYEIENLKTRQEQSRKDQLLYILDGKLVLLIRKKIFTLDSDSSAYIPAHTPYAFVNQGTEPVRGLSVSFKPQRRPSTLNPEQNANSQ